MLTGHETLRLLGTIASVDHAAAGWYCASVRYLCCDGSTLTLREGGLVELSDPRPGYNRTAFLQIDKKTARARMARDAAAKIATNLDQLASLSDESAAKYRAKAARRRSRLDLRQRDLDSAQHMEQVAAEARRRAAEWRAA